MIRQFLKDGLIYGAAGVFSRGIQILLIPIYTRVFVPEEYGVIDWIMILAALINLTVALEISQGVARYFSEDVSKEEKQGYASTALFFTILAYGMFSISCIVFSDSLSEFIFGSNQWGELLVVAVIAIGLNGVYILLQDMLRWNFKPVTYSLASIIYGLITSGVAIYLVLVPKMGIVSIFYGQAAGALSAGIVSWFYSRDIYKPVFDYSKCRKMLQYSLPLVLSSIAVFLNLYIDRISIRHIIGLDELGVYGVGFRFASIMSLLLIGFQATVTPLIFRNHANGETPANLVKILSLFLIMTGSLIVFLAMFSREILWLFTTEAYYAAWSVIPVLALTIMVSNSYIFAPGLNIAKQTGVIAYINIISAIANVFLNIILIPILGITGAAIASLLSAMLAFSLYLARSQKHYPVPYMWNRLSIYYLLILFSIAAGYVLHATDIPNSLSIYTKITISIVLPFVFVWVLASRGELKTVLTLINKKFRI